MGPLNKKRVLFVVAHDDFRDEEYFIPKEVLERKKVIVDTASSDITPAVSIKGIEADVDVVFQDVMPEIYDAIIIVGGRGARMFFDDAELHKLVRNFNDKGKVIGAICAAPVVLAKAGLLKGKKATVWFAENGNEYPEALKMSGADFLKKNVVVDGNIVTAGSPEDSIAFGNAIVSFLE